MVRSSDALAMHDDKTVSEVWFERYLRDHDHDGWQQHEPDLGAGKRPDYAISKGEARALCEVKEFTTTALRDYLVPGGAGSIPSRISFGAVRDAVKRAAEQVKPFAETGLPLVVVLANPHGADVDLSDPFQVLCALYGDPAFRITVGPDGPSGRGGSSPGAAAA